MNKQWKKFDELTDRCYTDMIQNSADMKNWNNCFRQLTEIISDGRAQNPDFARELYLLDDETDYEHGVEGWLEDYLDELDMHEKYDELEAVCRKLLEIFAWEEEYPSDIRFSLTSAMRNQGKAEEALSYCEDWAAKETDNPYAAAALIYAKMGVNDLEGAEEVVRRYISDDTECGEENDMIFIAAMRLYQKNGNKKREKEMNHAIEEYDKKVEEELLAADDEEFDLWDDEDFDSIDKALPFDWHM